MQGTVGGLVLRISQMMFTVAGLCLMITTSDFPTATAFLYFIVAAGLQIIWSLVLAIADMYALLVRHGVQNSNFPSLLAIGDGVMCILTFTAACASAGVTVLIAGDLKSCNTNHCKEFQTATAMGFLTWFVAVPSFLLNFWSFVSLSEV